MFSFDEKNNLGYSRKETLIDSKKKKKHKEIKKKKTIKKNFPNMDRTNIHYLQLRISPASSIILKPSPYLK